MAEAFHWSEAYILGIERDRDGRWVGLPLSRAEQYYHWLLRRARWRTYAPAESAESQLDRLDKAILTWAPGGVDPEVERAFQLFCEKQ